MKTITTIAIVVLIQGCCYHKEIKRIDGSMEKLHIGFPEFSDGKVISIVTVN